MVRRRSTVRFRKGAPTRSEAGSDHGTGHFDLRAAAKCSNACYVSSHSPSFLSAARVAAPHHGILAYVDGRSFPGQADRSPGRANRDLALGRRGFGESCSAAALDGWHAGAMTGPEPQPKYRGPDWTRNVFHLLRALTEAPPGDDPFDVPQFRMANKANELRLCAQGEIGGNAREDHVRGRAAGGILRCAIRQCNWPPTRAGHRGNTA
jgi:hypothetical protein